MLPLWLYWSIQDGAKKLLYPDFLPDKQQNRDMSAQEYARKLYPDFLPDKQQNRDMSAQEYARIFPASWRIRCGEN